MNFRNLRRTVAQLEREQQNITAALTVLREILDTSPKRLSPDGRKAISDAAKLRWKRWRGEGHTPKKRSRRKKAATAKGVAYPNANQKSRSGDLFMHVADEANRPQPKIL